MSDAPPPAPPPEPPPPGGWGPSWPTGAEPPPPLRRSRTGLIVGLAVAGLAGLVLWGVLLVNVVGSSRRSQQAEAGEDASDRSSGTSARGPRVGDHWHAPYRVYVCDRYLAPVEGNADRGGIHSHDDGVVHIEPAVASSAGSKATFRRFEEAHGLRISSSSLRWLDGAVPVEADAGAGCGGQEAEIVTFVDGRRVAAAPGSVRLRDGRAIVVALVPEGTMFEQLGGP